MEKARAAIDALSLYPSSPLLFSTRPRSRRLPSSAGLQRAAFRARGRSGAPRGESVSASTRLRRYRVDPCSLAPGWVDSSPRPLSVGASRAPRPSRRRRRVRVNPDARRRSPTSRWPLEQPRRSRGAFARERPLGVGQASTKRLRGRLPRGRSRRRERRARPSLDLESTSATASLRLVAR